MSKNFDVDIEATMDVIEAAHRFHWTWEVPDVERFSAAVGWQRQEIEDATVVWLTTRAHLSNPDAYFEMIGDRIKRVTVSVTDIVDPDANDLLAGVFDTTSTRVSQSLGAPDLEVTSPSPMSWWRVSECAIELALLDRSVVVSLIPPDVPHLIDEIEVRKAMVEYTAAKWEAFTERLANFLSELPSSAKLILEASGKRYVQFAQYDTELYAELASNEFLDQPITSEAEQFLRSTGWHDPAHYGSRVGNWHRRLPWPTPFAGYTTLARATTSGLRDALRVDTPKDLTAYGWMDGEDLDLTELAPVVGATPGLS
ncbi:DUF6301 family protein [Nocardia sp. Marseille-Q1738]